MDERLRLHLEEMRWQLKHGYHTCPQCIGQGYVYLRFGGMAACPVCGGTGWINPDNDKRRKAQP